MKKRASKVLAGLLAASMLWSLSVPAQADENVEAQDDIVVLYTNDIHCTSDDGMSYAAIAGYKGEMEAAYGADRVTLVDNGDAIQGAVLGTLSEGEWIVDIMNQVGYDLAIPGNHEFDFGMDQFLDIVRPPEGGLFCVIKNFFCTKWQLCCACDGRKARETLCPAISRDLRSIRMCSKETKSEIRK